LYLAVKLRRFGPAVIPEGNRRGFHRHPPSTMLVPQGRDCAQPLSEIHAACRHVEHAVTADLRAISNAATRAAAQVAIEIFKARYAAKYARAATCLTRDTEALLAFYDLPGEHWDQLRTSNPIESVFATVRHRNVRTKGAPSQKTAKLMVFTLVRADLKKWRKLNGTYQLPRVIEGVKFTDVIAQSDAARNRAA